MTYDDFLSTKRHHQADEGFTVKQLPSFLFDFQASLVEWALRKGKAAIFADCGLGKTPMQLVWAQQVLEHTNKPVLIVTPLAVGAQTIKEAHKFGMEIVKAEQWDSRPSLVVTNYERLHKLNAADFVGMVCDESSILKNFEGSIKASITECMRQMPYRLLCTATAAPNDYIEFGTSSEALGGLGYMDMLGMFFKNDQNSLNPVTRSRYHTMNQAGKMWRFKPHAERPFWRWICSWARALRKPSDLGFDDRRFLLPELRVKQTIVAASRPLDGQLFILPAVGLDEQRNERRHTIQERCEMAAQKVSTSASAVVWCHLNDEGDLLEDLIPGSVQVSGKDTDDEKEAKFEAFATGQARVMVSKPVVAGFGLNWQHCAHMTFFPSHSFEQYYQGIRRCWRFGQTKPVTVDVITTEGESDVMRNLQRKAEAAEKAFAVIVESMNEELRIQRSEYAAREMEVPAWAC